jgi:hypothetical protein
MVGPTNSGGASGRSGSLGGWGCALVVLERLRLVSLWEAASGMCWDCGRVERGAAHLAVYGLAEP